MNNKKYEMLKDDFIIYNYRKLYRIKALKDFEDVKKGDIGGYIEEEFNLSRYDNSWIYDNSQVYNNSQVYDNSIVCGVSTVENSKVINSTVKDSQIINADIYKATISDNSDYIVFKNNWSSGRFFTWTKSNNMWKVGCFYGTGEELIEKAYKDSKESGDKYKMYVELVESLENYNDL